MPASDGVGAGWYVVALCVFVRPGFQVTPVNCLQAGSKFGLSCLRMRSAGGLQWCTQGTDEGQIDLWLFQDALLMEAGWNAVTPTRAALHPPCCCFWHAVKTAFYSVHGLCLLHRCQGRLQPEAVREQCSVLKSKLQGLVTDVAASCTLAIAP